LSVSSVRAAVEVDTVSLFLLAFGQERDTSVDGSRQQGGTVYILIAATAALLRLVLV